MLGVQVRMTTSADDFSRYPGPKIVYGQAPQKDELFLFADGLLDNAAITPVQVKHGIHEGLPVLFKTSHPASCLPFDIFAAAFYMVSRYEEYLPFNGDRYGRFPASESIATKGKFLEIPVVHGWVELLMLELLREFPGMKFRPPSYKFIPTIDIDHAWCYLGRPLFRTLGGFGRSLLKGHPREMILRFLTLSGLMIDPFDNYQFLAEIHQKQGSQLIYFILNADYGGDDNNVSVSSARFHELIRELNRSGRVGIHPSLASAEDNSLLQNEISGLSSVLNNKIDFSRQHFLRFSFPETFNALIGAGISHDFSMGYASHPGFRAGIAFPFPFFDLTSNKVTPLTIHPVTMMDVTFKDYLRLNGQQSLEIMSGLIHKVKSVNGELVTIWHNESLGDHGRWHGWTDIYKEMVKLAT
jgi:hypothetical protein